jgi:hypothetical protein
MFLNPFKGVSFSAPNPLDVDWLVLFLDLGLLLFLIVLTAISSAFFNAGAIGMSYKAVDTGRCSLDDLTGYGVKRFFTLFLTNILIFVPLIIIAGILALIQYIFPGEFVSILVFGAGIVLSMVPYAVVIGDLGPIRGIKAGYGLFKENMFQTTLLYAFTYYFLLFSLYWVILVCMVICSMGLFVIPMPQELTIQGLVASVMPSIWGIGIALLLAAIFYVLAETLVILPITTVIWTTYYLSKIKHRRAV